jgi:triacylglycerol lipase
MYQLSRSIAAMTLALAGAAASNASASAVSLSDVKSEGAFAVSSQTIPAAGFGGATIYSPDKAGKYAVVAISPGFIAKQSAISVLARRLATHGFVVVLIDTKTVLDFPASRATQLLAALKAACAVTTGPVAGKIDVTRQAVAGHSMGGGGALQAAASTPSLKAVVAYAPWDLSSTPYRKLTVPAALIGGSADTVATVKTFAQSFYNAIPATTTKTLAVIEGADHLFPQTDNATQPPNEPTSYTQISWFKRFADQNTDYNEFLRGKDSAWSSFTTNGSF